MISEQWEERHKRQLQSPRRASAKVVFLGDSITDAWRMSPSYRKHFGKYTPVNLGISGEYTQNLLWRIKHGALEGMNPGAVVLMIGVNNLAGSFTPKQTVAGVRAVVKAIRAHLSTPPILLLAILPAREKPDARLRKKIVETNELLRGLSMPGVSFHDVGSVMLETDGTMKKVIFRDFLHPTETGYERLCEAVAPLLDQLVH